MSVYATIQDVTVYSGGQGRLGSQTARMTVTLSDLSRQWPQVALALDAQRPEFRAGDAEMDLPPQEWPMGLLVADAALVPTYAHWVAALCVAFQRWAGDPVGPGQVLEVDGDKACLLLPWVRSAVLDVAVQLAVRHVLIHCELAHERAEKAALVAEDLQHWLDSVRPGGLSPNAMALALAASRKGIPVKVRVGHLQLGWGRCIERLDMTFTGRTSNIASKLARDKSMTKQLLWEAAIPVPEGTVAYSHEQALQFVARTGWPVAVKPFNQDGGVAVTPGILDEMDLKLAYDRASAASGGAVIVERHIAGHDHRMLVVGGELLAVTRRIPGGVVGDGQHAVMELMDLTNQNPLRGHGQNSPLIALSMDDEALICLNQQGLKPDSVPEPGRAVYLRRTANISTGGTAQDVLAHVHPDNKALALRAARIVGLDVAGVDFICPDISRSWMEVGGAVCEVNGQPGFRVHRRGNPDQDVDGALIDWLCAGRDLRIPTAAITGTNGKTTVSRMLHHLWLVAGRHAGVTTTQGVWVGTEQVSSQNLSGYPGATLLLDDPAVEVAVMELPRKGLIRFGHPCDRYDVAALLNVQDDHIGVDGIESLEAMARLKAQVLERASQAVVVNAQDLLTVAMLAHAQAPRHILVSGREDAPALLAHREQGGEAVWVQVREDAPWIVHAQGNVKTPIMPLHDVPAMMDGLIAFNRDNALFAVALGLAQGLAASTIRAGMSTFVNDEVHNPGRCNFFTVLPFTAVLDFGHNPDGVQRLCEMAKQAAVQGDLRLVCLNVGNRHRKHLQAVAPSLAQTFSHMVLGCDPDYVQQNPEYASDDPVRTMLQFAQASLLEAGARVEGLMVEPDPLAALQTGLRMAQPGDFLLVLAEPELALPVLRDFQSRHAAASPSPPQAN